MTRWKRTYDYAAKGHMDFRQAFHEAISQLEPDGQLETVIYRVDMLLEAHVKLIEILTEKGVLSALDLETILGPSFKRISE